MVLRRWYFMERYSVLPVSAQEGEIPSWGFTSVLWRRLNSSPGTTEKDACRPEATSGRIYLRMENPIRLPDLFERGRRSAENIASWLCRDGLIAKHTRELVYCAGTARQANDCIIRAIREVGYDGIVYENDQEGGTNTVNEESYVAFELSQIRSAFHWH